MNGGMLLVALGCGRLPTIFDITARYHFVVFGTMDGNVFSGLTDCVADEILRNRKSTKIVPRKDSQAIAKGISILIGDSEEADQSEKDEDITWVNQVIAIEEIARRVKSGSSK